MKTQIVKADTIDEARKICSWATMFQRTNDYKKTNNWICSTFVN
jgi:hypothetical protein